MSAFFFGPPCWVSTQWLSSSKWLARGGRRSRCVYFCAMHSQCSRSRKDETQYSGQNRNRNPRWSSQIFSNGSFEHSIAPNRLLCSSFEKQISTVEAEFEKILWYYQESPLVLSNSVSTFAWGQPVLWKLFGLWCTEKTFIQVSCGSGNPLNTTWCLTYPSGGFAIGCYVPWILYSKEHNNTRLWQTEFAHLRHWCFQYLNMYWQWRGLVVISAGQGRKHSYSCHVDLISVVCQLILLLTVWLTLLTKIYFGRQLEFQSVLQRLCPSAQSRAKKHHIAESPRVFECLRWKHGFTAARP